MPKLIPALCLALLVTGCASTSKKTRAAQKEFEATIPVCSGKLECDTMWSVAEVWTAGKILSPLTVTTDTLIETKESFGTNTAVRIVKEPAGEPGNFRIVISAWCKNRFTCVPDTAEVMLDFNRTLNEIDMRKDRPRGK